MLATDQKHNYQLEWPNKKKKWTIVWLLLSRECIYGWRNFLQIYNVASLSGGYLHCKFSTIWIKHQGVTDALKSWLCCSFQYNHSVCALPVFLGCMTHYCVSWFCTLVCFEHYEFTITAIIMMCAFMTHIVNEIYLIKWWHILWCVIKVVHHVRVVIPYCYIQWCLTSLNRTISVVQYSRNSEGMGILS